MCNSWACSIQCRRCDLVWFKQRKRETKFGSSKEREKYTEALADSRRNPHSTIKETLLRGKFMRRNVQVKKDANMWSSWAASAQFSKCDPVRFQAKEKRKISFGSNKKRKKICEEFEPVRCGAHTQWCDVTNL